MSNDQCQMTNEKWALKRFYQILIITGAGLLLTLPCILYGFPYYGDDSAANAVYSTTFAQQFRAGDLYPRWLLAINGGLGSPVTFYYPPFAWSTTSLLKF